jgi:hypothetical protein
MIPGWNNLTGLGSQFRDSVQQDPWVAINLLDDVVTAKSAKNALFFAPVVAYEAAKAPRGEKVGTFGSGAISLAAMPGLGWLATRGLQMVAPTLGGPVGWVAATVGSIALAGYSSSWLRTTAHRGLRYLHNHERDLRRLEMGGNFVDTRNTSLLRQRAVSDMSSAFGNARSFLGREGAFLHR